MLDRPHGVRTLVVAASAASLENARGFAARLAPHSVLVVDPRRLARGVDRDQVDVALLAVDSVAAQRDAVRRLKSFPRPLPVLALSDGGGDRLGILLRAGADGLVSPDASTEALQRCLRAAAEGELVVSRALTRAMAAEIRILSLRSERVEAGLRTLSEREREVAVLAYGGLSTAEVGSRLHLTPATVRSHLHRAVHKVRGRSRDDLFRLLDEA